MNSQSEHPNAACFIHNGCISGLHSVTASDDHIDGGYTIVLHAYFTAH